MKIKKIFIKILILILLLVPLTGCSSDSFEYVNCGTHDGCISLIKYTGNNKEINIPRSIDNNIVCSVRGYLFYDAMNNKKIIGEIPENISIGVFDYVDYGTEIYDYYDCEIEAGVVYYRDRVVNIHEDEVGEELVIREGTKYLAYDSSVWYNNGRSIKFAYFPGSLKKIENYMFHYALLNVEVLYFGEGIEEIGLAAFEYCEKIKHIYFPSTIKKIGSSAFGKSPSYLDVYLPDSIEELHFASFGKGTIRISGTLDDINWGIRWDEDGYLANFKIITEHNNQYFCSNCNGYKNEDYNGTGHKCICN